METKTAFSIKVLDRVKDVYLAEITRHTKRRDKWMALRYEKFKAGADKWELEELDLEVETSMDAIANTERKLQAIREVIMDEHLLPTHVILPTEELLPTLTQ